jgi:ribosomal protein L37AE/L43A
MGQGAIYMCGSCGNEEFVNLGVGMAYPSVYHALVEEIERGEHGERLQEYFAQHPGAVVDAGRELYQCPSCHGWHVEPNLSLYVHEREETPEHGYWVPWGFGEEDNPYRFVEKYAHICPDCHEAMERVEDLDAAILPCPRCGAPMSPESTLVRWD